MPFTDRLWQGIAPIYEAILLHPFLQELSDGSLERERFVFYMKQDALYLQDFSRALALAAVRSSDVSNLQSFLGSANGALTVERSLHEGYFQQFEATLDVDKSPACFSYTNYLLAVTTTGSYAEAIAALLPCFWIYREVSTDIYRRAEGSLQSNPYARWVETYAGAHFDESVDRVIGITEAVAAGVSAAEKARMQRAFTYSARLEWMFWDSAYRLEQWQPVSD